MKFIDETQVRVVGGKGGSGAVHWRREKYVPKGGPDGGDGGDGGAVIFVAATGLNTLLECALNPLIRAESGHPGGENGKTGARGVDATRRVPVGTQVFYGDELVADLCVAGSQWVAARGGRGGKGNTHFKSSTNRAPDRAQPGRPGDERELRLVLKSVADVGLVGLPNVGKSSLVRALSEAHPLVADYPFTTVRPSLGVVSLDDQRRFVIADIPGLVEGAHSGKGLGHQFLRHIERTAVLVYVLDCTQEPLVQQSLTTDGECSDELLQQTILKHLTLLRDELVSFSPELADRPQVVAFSKCDLALQQRCFALFEASSEAAFKAAGFLHPLAFCSFSSHTEQGLEPLKQLLFERIERLRAEAR